MDIQTKLKYFAELGEQLQAISTNLRNNEFSNHIAKAQANNAWFTDESISFALAEIGESLAKQNLEQWIAPYQLDNPKDEKTIGLVLAGNIPLVGFHDMLCTLISGNKVLAKLSSKDQHLYQIIFEILVAIDPDFSNLITFTENRLENIDAIIATGSDNSARYFEYYFSKYPHIIRKNRNSVAILNGNESDEDLQNLGQDIFTYFGLGCRNVSFLLVPEGFDFIPLMQNLEKFIHLADHQKYGNNYDYQRAILLMNKISIYDNGCIILNQENNLSSPIGLINYQFYNSDNTVENFIKNNKEGIQCVVSKTKWNFPTYSFGEAQKPKLWDYADNVDTLKFLIDLN